MEVFRLLMLYRNNREELFRCEPFSEEALAKQKELGVTKKIKREQRIRKNHHHSNTV